MKLAKVNEQLALRNRRSKILGEIALVIGLLIFVWGIAGGAFAVINYEGVIKGSDWYDNSNCWWLEVFSDEKIVLEKYFKSN